jgi:RIO kinase 1
MKQQLETLTLSGHVRTQVKGQILVALDNSRKSKIIADKVVAAPTTSAAFPEKQQLDRDLTELAEKYNSRIKLNFVPELFGSQSTGRKADDGKYLNKDKADRATVEQVLDPRTRMILFKLINRGIVYEINGCISTGKEANVYHALTPEKDHLAIKIYKTSILVFKDRDRYVSGEYRFRHGYSKSNPRKMVQTWAEKEMRNLKRLQV